MQVPCHLVSRLSSSARKFSYVFVFRLYSRAIRPVQNLDPHRRSVRGCDLQFPARQGDSLGDLPANACCRAVAEKGRSDLVRLEWSSDLEPEAGPSFLHVRGPNLNIECARSKECFPQRLQVLGAQIVHISRQQHDLSSLHR